MLKELKEQRKDPIVRNEKGDVGRISMIDGDCVLVQWQTGFHGMRENLSGKLVEATLTWEFANKLKLIGHYEQDKEIAEEIPNCTPSIPVYY